MPNVIVSPTGVQGPRGNAVLNGTGAPASAVGIDGDFYVDTAASNLYGPKASGAWPGTSVHIGAAGALLAANNLSDLGSPATALTNLARTQGRNPLTGMWHPEAYGAVGDYTTDDTAAVNACIDACSAAGGGVVRLGRHAVSGTGLVPKSGVTLRGIPGYSSVKQTSPGQVNAITSAVSCSDIGFEDFTIEGPVNQVVTVPTAARTTSGDGTYIGILLDGDLDPTGTGLPTITNVVIRNLTVKNTTYMPIKIFGVRGRTLVEGCRFYNTFDAGWGFCEEVQVIGCHSLMSADNGFSISRGNTKITCVGNTVETAAYNGIWLSGYTGYTGPTDFTCTGNTILNVGQNGIILMDAPQYGTISDNMINKGYYRGPVDQPQDTLVCGIMVRGSSTTPNAPGTTVAYGLKIADNTIAAAAHAGIMYDGATSVVISDNLILDCGTQYKSDGVTAIAASDTTQNVGILCDYPATAASCVVRNNDIIDSRATPYCNWGVFPPQIAGVTTVGNTMTGCRNSSNLPALLDSYTDMRVSGGQSTMPRWAAGNSTMGMSSGTVRFAYFNAWRNAAVTAIRINSGSTTAGATPTLVQFGLYSVDASGTLTLMSSTANDTSIFAAALTTYQRDLATPQTIQAGQQYAIGVIVVTTATAPTICGLLAATGGENASAPTLCGFMSGQAALPASVAAANIAQTQALIYAVAVGA